MKDDYIVAIIIIYVLWLLTWIAICGKLGYRNNARFLWALLLSFPPTTFIAMIFFLLIPSPNEKNLKRLKKEHESALEESEQKIEDLRRKYVESTEKMKQKYERVIELERLKNQNRES